MIDFINGKSSKAEFIIDNQKITLYTGDKYKGFKHILEKHYYPNDLETMDILNMMDTFAIGLKLNNDGVTNPDNTVYRSIKNRKEHNLVLKSVGRDLWVVTFYRKTS